MKPVGAVFDKPVEIRMPYDPDAVDNPQDIRVVRYSSGTLDYIQPKIVDTVANEVIFETEHFTYFSLAESKGFWNSLSDLSNDRREITEFLRTKVGRGVAEVHLKPEVLAAI